MLSVQEDAKMRMAQQMMTFSPSSSSPTGAAAATQFQHHLSSFNVPVGNMESGYSSGFSLTRPLESFDVTKDASLTSAMQQPHPGTGEVQTTPRTTAAINYMSALQLSTPRMGIRSGRKGTPLKRQPSLFSHSAVYETTPKKAKSHENNENETSYVSRSASALKVPFRARLDRSLSQTMSPLAGCDKLDCTFDAISSSTPICQPFRAEFYEQQQVEAIPIKNMTRSGGKHTRTKIIRKMQSFSPRKLMGLRAAKIPLREMDQNSVDFHSGGLFPVEEEESPILRPSSNTGAVKKVLFGDEAKGGAFTNGLRDLMFGTIKTDAQGAAKEVEKHKAEDDILNNLDTTNNNYETSAMKGEEEDVDKAHRAGDHKEAQQETSSQLLDIYVTNLSNLDGGDSNSNLAVTAEDGDVSMVGDVERYFDELKRNTTQIQEGSPVKFVPVTAKDSLHLYEMLSGAGEGEASAITDTMTRSTEEESRMEVEVQIAAPVAVEDLKLANNRPPMLLRKRKRPSTELIQAVLATPKKMRRSQSFHIGDGHSTAATTDENDFHSSSSSSSSTRCLIDASNDAMYLVSPTDQRLSGARKRLNYEPVARKRFSPAKRALAFDGVFRRRSLNGTARLNIFRHLANCPPVRDYFFEFVEDKDLAAIYAVSRQCRAMIEEHPRLNGRRVKYLEAAWRKKENENSVNVSAKRTSSPEDTCVLRVQGEVVRIPLHSRNVDTSCASSATDTTMSPPVSPSRRKFYENQKLVQRNPGAFFVSCPRCRSSSVIERADENYLSQSDHQMDDDHSFSFRSLRSQSICSSDLSSRNTSLMIPVRKQFSLPDNASISTSTNGRDNGPEQRMGVCQSIQCGFRFCVHCSYAFERGHKCIEIGTLSPLIKQSRQPRVVACSKQSKRNLKRL